ncbi:MAG: hypothetical protein KAJ97_00435 [Acidobacteria bacterium]|nr:hypothetical protein [Acidobacteriota bacterium]
MREVKPMSKLRTSGLITALLLVMVVVVVAAQGYVVILKSGHKLRCREPLRIEGSNAIITLVTGVVTSYPLDLVDLVETERYNQQGLGSALLIEELSATGTPVPTPTPRRSLGQYTTLNAGGTSPELGTTVQPTPLPTPGIKLQTIPYHDQRIDRAFSKLFDEKKMYIYRTSQGTRPNFFFVQTMTDSEREVFAALKTVAEAYTLIYGLHQELAPTAVELEMIQTSGKAAGTFRLTPALAQELATEKIAIQKFYMQHVIF